MIGNTPIHSPYNDEAFVKAYRDLLQSFEQGYGAVAEARSVLRRVLSDIDYEYMTWVERKGDSGDTSRTPWGELA